MLIIFWFRHLPQIDMDLSDWTPFIQNDWYRKHYMKFVYLLQFIIFLMPFFFETHFTYINNFSLIIIVIIVFIIHEYIHIVTINKKGDISLTFSGFFWLNTNAVLSKSRFWFFMSLPFIVLSVIPAIMALYVPSNIKPIIVFVSWINAVISASDIINSFLIAIKPKSAVFYRGFYRVK
ncbi:DUF3267 domain-containing protein [Lysinibacillus sp. FSL K6-0057]|uniref:DUF3267 domain-containing protein n=1 Tax=Lysinibacillus sp. FSL K6-0057 TaxID=2921411 RepID=UPI00315AA5C2